MIRHKPGYTAWKFVFQDRISYRASNAGAMKYFYDSQDQAFAMYCRTIDGWKWAAEHQPSDTCGCGRLYTDTFNGLEFKFRDAILMPYKTIAECIAIFELPVLCQVCYYSKEYKAGRFCPVWVRKQLGVE